MKNILLSLWGYRYFIFSSIKNEFKTRFVRSKFGAIWIIIHPLTQVLVYALILSNILQAKLPHIQSQYAYSIYLLSGIVIWNLFIEILTKLLNIFISNANLIQKVNFPKLTLPIIAIGSSLVNFVLLFMIMLIVFAILGHIPYHAIIYIIIPTIITLALATGLGIFLGTLNVFIRDIGQVMEVVINFWFWLTPIVYMLSIIPQHYQWLIMLNPMSGIVIAFQDILVYDKTPDWDILLYPGILSVLMLILALFTFKKATKEMADVL